MLSNFSLVHFVFMSAFLINSSGETIQKSPQAEGGDDSVLSRKRRYLVFPEGASFQLVFCFTYTSVAVGSYFVFGHTAAIAWQLPSEPMFFDQRDFQKKDEELADTTTTEMPHEQAQRRTSLGSAYNRPFEGFIKNPGYSGWGNNESFQNRRYNKQSHMRLDMDPKYYHAHRRTRRELYTKIEKFLTSLNHDGKACLLKAICEVHQLPHEKGGLLEEMFKAIFRAKPHDKYKNEDEYDVAANVGHNCDEVYRTCSGSIRNVHLLIKK